MLASGVVPRLVRGMATCLVADLRRAHQAGEQWVLPGGVALRWHSSRDAAPLRPPKIAFQFQVGPPMMQRESP